MELTSISKKFAMTVAWWLGLSATAFMLYWGLWYVIDKETYDEGGYAWDIILFDFAYCAIYCACSMTICRLTYSLFVRHIAERWGYVLSSLLALIANLVVAMLFEVVANMLFYNADPFILSEGIYIYSLIATILSGFMISFKHYDLYREQFDAHKAAEIGRLKSQMNPHFVFNNLASLDGLIEKDTGKAHDYLTKLSHIYRYFLKHADDNTVTIAEAIAFIRSYAELLAVSHEGHFRLSIGDGLDGCSQRIICISLQLLVENALKHNIHSADNPIDIIIERDGDYLSIKNTFRPNNVPTEPMHMGLVNLDERCRQYAKRGCQIMKSGDWFEVRIPVIS